jgi:glycosyltransferase involved in cell wall biosynthesis
MRIAYANTGYDQHQVSGSSVHVSQFVGKATELGHEIWMWPGHAHPVARVFPVSRFGVLMGLRKMDAVVIRVEWRPPAVCRWGLSPWRNLLGSPAIVWEVNAVPEYGRTLNMSEAAIKKATEDFERYGQGCDLALCGSRLLADYLQNQIGIKRVHMVPYGSEPDLFRPDAPPVNRIRRSADCLNVVWIGKASIPWNNFELLRDAALMLEKNEHGRSVVFHILGPSINGMMREMPSNVNYLGAEQYERVPSWLAAMDVGLCLYRPGPADYVSPFKLFDYMASGLAVVGTPQPQVREVFTQMGQEDLIVPHDDPKALAEALIGLATDRDRVRRQGRAGRELVLNNYNWRRVVRDTLEGIDGAVRFCR